ncbi:hypothetical protein [Cellulomonas endometrii]|uniref:hypothetical protein n=1 Tax=Cellulomonas endometrii TaxID=3036301 RepID=UPI0024ADCC72|nr:hypothetical protein [Cellulomonas endometrii]
MGLRSFIHRLSAPTPAPESFPNRRPPTGVDVAGDTAASLAAVLFSQKRWQFRKVESRLFQEGSYSVTRVSIDCVPHALPGLRYQLDDVEPTGPNDSLVLVPITVMQKGALRSFDMRDGAGNAMPVIGRSEYSGLMIETLIFEVGDAAVVGCDTGVLREALHAVVDADPHEAGDVAVDLVVDGTYRGVRCLNPEEMTTYAANLILSLTDSYVMIALLPEQQAGRRQVIKYGHHSVEHFERPTSRDHRSGLAHVLQVLKDRFGFTTGPIKRFRLAAGLEAMKIKFDLSHPEGSASHHFEVVIPDGLRCERLNMPAGYAHADRNTVDTTPTGVAHAVAAYDRNPDDGAVVEFRVPLEGLRQTAAVVCLITSAMLLLGLLLPGPQDALLSASDGAAALLLAVPAVVFALAVGGGEHEMVAWMLRPLRFVVVGCALLLLACAGSIVGVLHDWARYPMWWAGAVATLVTGITLAWTAVRVLVRRLMKNLG